MRHKLMMPAVVLIASIATPVIAKDRVGASRAGRADDRGRARDLPGPPGIDVESRRRLRPHRSRGAGACALRRRARARGGGDGSGGRQRTDLARTGTCRDGATHHHDGDALKLTPCPSGNVCCLKATVVSFRGFGHIRPASPLCPTPGWRGEKRGPEACPGRRRKGDGRRRLFRPCGDRNAASTCATRRSSPYSGQSRGRVTPRCPIYFPARSA